MVSKIAFFNFSPDDGANEGKAMCEFAFVIYPLIFFIVLDCITFLGSDATGVLSNSAMSNMFCALIVSVFDL